MSKEHLKAEIEASFSPVRAILRYESIVEQIMNLVKSGILKVGDKFPTERALSEKWRVSRPVLREAFRVLEAQGIVESRHGAGRYLRSDRTIEIGKTRREHLIDKRQAFLEIWEFRSLLEVKAAELAASNATDEQIAAIFRPIELLEALPAEESLKTDMSMEIHMAIAAASGNIYLQKAIHDALDEYRILSFKEAVPIEYWKSLQSEHRPIAEAIRERSPKAAHNEMKRHFSGLRKALKDWST